MSGLGVVCNCCNVTKYVLACGIWRTNSSLNALLTSAFGGYNQSTDIYDYDMIVAGWVEASPSDPGDINEVVTQTSIPSDWSGRILLMCENSTAASGAYITAMNSFPNTPFTFSGTYTGDSDSLADRISTDIPDQPTTLYSLSSSTMSGGTTLYETDNNPNLAQYYSDDPKLWVGIGDSEPFTGAFASDPTAEKAKGITWLQAIKASAISIP